jgi:PAS domain S-box-containing protein
MTTIARSFFVKGAPRCGVVVLLWLGLLLPAGGAVAGILSDAQRAYIEALGPLTVAPDPDWLPFEHMDEEGRFTGIVADLLALIEQRLHIEFVYIKAPDWEEALARSRTGEVLILPFLNQTPAREEWLLFTEPLLVDPNVFITHAEHEYIGDASELQGRLMVLPSGTSMEERVRRDFPNLTITNVASEELVFDAIQERRADMTLRSLTVSAYTIRKEGLFNLKISGHAPEAYRNEFRMGVRKDAPMLRDILNAAIATITPDERQDIINRHVRITVVDPVDYVFIWRLTAVVSGFVLLSLFWNWRLRRSRAALAESERSYAAVLAHLPGLVYRCANDADWTMEFMSDGCRALTGYAPEDFIDNRLLSFNEIILPEYRARLRGTWDRAIATHADGIREEYRIRAADGTEKWVYEQGVILRDRAGKVQHLEGMLIDITDRVAAETELEEQRRRLAAILEGADIGTWDWNVATGDCVFNERWAQMVGYTAKELEPHSYRTWLNLIEPEDMRRSEALLKRLFNRELDFYEVEVRMRHKAGHHVWVLARGSVAGWTSDGKPLRMLGTHQDIDARKRLEEELRLHSSLQELSATVAREFLTANALNIDGQINYLLARCGRYIGVGRAYLFAVDEVNGTFSNTHEWCAAGVPSCRADLQGVPLQEYPVLADTVAGRKVFAVPDVEDMEPGQAVLQAALKEQQIKSVIVIPLLAGERLLGYLGMDGVHHRILFTEHHVQSLRMLGNLLSVVLTRAE